MVPSVPTLMCLILFQILVLPNNSAVLDGVPNVATRLHFSSLVCYVSRFWGGNLHNDRLVDDCLTATFLFHSSVSRIEFGICLREESLYAAVTFYYQACELRDFFIPCLISWMVLFILRWLLQFLVAQAIVSAMGTLEEHLLGGEGVSLCRLRLAVSWEWIWIGVIMPIL